MTSDDLRYGYFWYREYEERKRKKREKREDESEQECERQAWSLCFRSVFCCVCADCCFEDRPREKYACGASLSGMFYGGLLTGWSVNSSTVGLGIGIAAAVLGTLTAAGLCVQKLCLSSSSTTEQVPPFLAPPFQAPPLQAPPFQAPAFQAAPFQAPPFQAPPFQAPSFQAPTLQASQVRVQYQPGVTVGPPAIIFQPY